VTGRTARARRAGLTDAVGKLGRSLNPASSDPRAQNLAEGAVGCGVTETGSGGALSAAVQRAVDVDEAGGLGFAEARSLRCGGRGRGGE
jgi:hypothetical protein